MNDAERLRVHAERYLALATKAYDRGDHAYAELLALRAGDYLDKAVAMDAAEASPPKPRTAQAINYK